MLKVFAFLFFTSFILFSRELSLIGKYSGGYKEIGSVDKVINIVSLKKDALYIKNNPSRLFILTGKLTKYYGEGKFLFSDDSGEIFVYLDKYVTKNVIIDPDNIFKVSFLIDAKPFEDIILIVKKIQKIEGN